MLGPSKADYIARALGHLLTGEAAPTNCVPVLIRTYHVALFDMHAHLYAERPCGKAWTVRAPIVYLWQSACGGVEVTGLAETDGQGRRWTEEATKAIQRLRVGSSCQDHKVLTVKGSLSHQLP